MKKSIIKYIALLILLFLSGTNTFAAGLTYHYDDLNRLVRVEYEDGSYVAYDYDNTGNRTNRTISVSGTTLVRAMDSAEKADAKILVATKSGNTDKNGN